MAEQSPPSGFPSGSPSRWAAWLQQASEPFFLLNRKRRLRFVNAAMERMLGQASEQLLGINCSGRRTNEPLGHALRVPPEVVQGRVEIVRRALPNARVGPPWWEITFVPLSGNDGLLGILGRVQVIAPPPIPTASGKPRAFSEALMALRLQTAQQFSMDLLRGEGVAMQRLLAQVRLGMQTRTPIWLIGEPGSGKSTTARIIHHQGVTREGTFARIRPATLPNHLVASMLLGLGGLLNNPHLGCLLIDSPEHLSADVQHAILDWADDAPASAPRLILASGQSADLAVQSGGILPEFAARFAVLEISVPPLRSRIDELPRIVRSMLEAIQQTSDTPIPSISQEFNEILKAYSWPGNLRELREALTHAVRAANDPGQKSDGKLDASLLPRGILEVLRFARIPPRTVSNTSQPFLALDPILEQVERRMIILALKKTNGNRAAAAEMLGIWRTRLLRRIDALKIED
ncbi:helix-turn-helix domain-containing protein [Tuwongella immobilis]|uniref:Sigma-54 factor interaction domain-containing protein n=1 Tax=Tuwongella immobilis TaxID=692036 RepID=A0A6C2YKV8_9BACT|nr:helix-turn-helix domain-containing protein [Tuwongella immobilis]VIP02014.1 response regulator with -like aaa-type and dna-binding domains : Response regulator with CheY-like receiver, AAA-type ATPase, and DNA-binding domains OS=Singulisphaera acidiphila (strain ATCC BAA-1392 / DSM 18658 / VKM B-2454 / MOB10) GN=Sinac_5293 PE=4 SV=1: PAS: Sigma54_activ_2: HTH_8 [Tuwongella immobilis]VTS00128.1 response regulator with -like aaa-type and dna-binding domains : Response regulator with CheY-like re